MGSKRPAPPFLKGGRPSVGGFFELARRIWMWPVVIIFTGLLRCARNDAVIKHPGF